MEGNPGGKIPEATSTADTWVRQLADRVSETAATAAYRPVATGELDWRRFKDARVESFRTDEINFLGTYEQILGRSDEQWQAIVAGAQLGEMSSMHVMADESGDYASFCQGKRQEGEKIRHVVHVGPVFTRPDARGRGLSRICLRACLDYWLAQEGVRKFSLEVIAENEGAKDLYESLGFEVIGIKRRELSYQGKDHDVLMMEFIPQSSGRNETNR